MVSAGSRRTCSATAVMSRIASPSRPSMDSFGRHMSKSLGINSWPISAAKISAHGLLQTRCANASLSDRDCLSMCRARPVASPQYPASARLFSSRYAASLVLHRTACSHLSCLPAAPIERDTRRATLTVNGPTSSLRRTFVSGNRDGSRPMARRNSGMTPWAMVSPVNGRATNSAS